MMLMRTMIVILQLLIICLLNFMEIFVQCFDAVGLGDRKGIRPVKILDVDVLEETIRLGLCTS